jgi:MoxR-like ATPase
MTALTRATRGHEKIRLGASPRASLGLYLASQAKAAIQGRNYVIPDDVKSLAVPVMAHRFIVKTEARMKGHSPEDIVKEILTTIPVPAEGKV